MGWHRAGGAYGRNDPVHAESETAASDPGACLNRSFLAQDKMDQDYGHQQEQADKQVVDGECHAEGEDKSAESRGRDQQTKGPDGQRQDRRQERIAHQDVQLPVRHPLVDERVHGKQHGGCPDGQCSPREEPRETGKRERG